jgi:hypothetical protein
MQKLISLNNLINKTEIIKYLLILLKNNIIYQNYI